MGNVDKQRLTIIQLKNELYSAKQEILKLRKIIGDLKKGKEHLIPVSEHEGLLWAAEERAFRAEMKALAFESELNNRNENGLYSSTPISTDMQTQNFPMVPGSSPGLTGDRHWETNRSPTGSPRFRQRFPVFKSSDYISLLVPNSVGSGPRRKPSVQYIMSTKKSGQLTKETGERKTRKSLISQIRRKLIGRRAARGMTDRSKLISEKKEHMDQHQQSILIRVHTKLFSRQRKRQSICDVPDLRSLAQMDYEVPKDLFTDFQKTPLIVEEAESGEDSGWSTSDEADGTQQRQRITCRPIPTKREKPPLPPKPKSPSIPAPAVSPTSEKSSHGENFQVAEDKPSKSYKRIPGPKGRQKAPSYLTLEADDGGDVPH